MVTFKTLAVERRTTSVPASVLLKHLAHLRKYHDDAFLHAGNLVVRLANHARREAVEDAVRDLCVTYDGVQRAVVNRVNDTGNRSTAWLYWHRDGTLDLVERLDTGQGHEPLLDRMYPRLEEFGGEPVPSGGRFDHSIRGYQRAPMAYLKLEHGFYGLPCYDVVFPTDDIERVPDPVGDERALTDLTYHLGLRPASHARRLDHESRARLGSVLEDIDGQAGVRIRDSDVSVDVVSLVVDAPATMSPRRTLNLLRSSAGRFNRQFVDDDSTLQWAWGHCIATGDDGADAVDAFGDGDRTDRRRDVRFHVAWGHRSGEMNSTERWREAFATVAEDHEFELTDVDIGPRTVQVGVSCPWTHAPWLLGHRLRAEAGRHLGPDHDVAWTDGICTATRPFTGAELRDYHEQVS